MRSIAIARKGPWSLSHAFLSVIPAAVLAASFLSAPAVAAEAGGTEAVQAARPAAEAPATPVNADASAAQAPACADQVAPAAPASSASAPAQASQAGAASSRFTPPVAMIRQFSRRSDLAAMQISLDLVKFVGEVDHPEGVDENTYAVLPLSQDSLVEVYDGAWFGEEFISEEKPSVSRVMGPNEAYVLKFDDGENPNQAICVTSRGSKHCWHPRSSWTGGKFLRWSGTKGMR